MDRPNHRPRIHWFAPLPPADTDIAHYTTRILPELSKTAEIVLWSDAEGEWLSELGQWASVRRFDPNAMIPLDLTLGLPAAQGPEALFIHIGNYWVYHAGLMRLAQRMPAVVVLHDLALQEMLLDSIRYTGYSKEKYRAGMYRWYGRAGLEMADKLLAEELPAYEAVAKAPGFELLLDRAVSVLTHTPAAFQAVKARSVLPAYHLDLPFQPSETASAARKREGPLRLVQFGYIGPNRRLSQTLEALSGLRDEFDFHLDVVGKIWDRDLIAGQVAEMGLTGRVTLHGFLPEAELDKLLSEAHLVFNLRHPTMGEASGSQLRIWNAAALSVVTDHGWYHTLPDETTLKIPLENEIPALQELLRDLAQDHGARHEAVAQAGRERLLRFHNPQLYAEGIEQVARRFTRDAHATLLSRAAQSVLPSEPLPGDNLTEEFR